jgi:hypothetical protein
MSEKMILKDIIKKIGTDKTATQWKKKNPDFYLVHAFTMLDEQEKKYRWELGYYSKSKDKLVVIATDPAIKIGDEEDVFKKEGAVSPLEFSKVKLSVAKAMEICDKLLKEKYPAQNVTKRIILLQATDRQIYNITLVTRSFAIINIKIDAINGEIVNHNLQSIMGLGNWEKGEGKKAS